MTLIMTSEMLKCGGGEYLTVLKKHVCPDSELLSFKKQVWGTVSSIQPCGPTSSCQSCILLLWLWRNDEHEHETQLG